MQCTEVGKQTPFKIYMSDWLFISEDIGMLNNLWTKILPGRLKKILLFEKQKSIVWN